MTDIHSLNTDNFSVLLLTCTSTFLTLELDDVTLGWLNPFRSLWWPWLYKMRSRSHHVRKSPCDHIRCECGKSQKCSVIDQPYINYWIHDPWVVAIISLFIISWKKFPKIPLTSSSFSVLVYSFSFYLSRSLSLPLPLSLSLSENCVNICWDQGFQRQLLYMCWDERFHARGTCFLSFYIVVPRLLYT